MYKTSSHLENGHSAAELHQLRRWLRIGYGSLALLFTWNLLLSAGILMPLRSTTLPAMPQVPVMADYSPSIEVVDSHLNSESNNEISSLESRSEKNISDIVDLQVDQDGPVDGRYSRHTTLLLKTIAVTNVGFGLWGVVDDCRDYSEGEGAKSGIKCVYGAISSAVAVAVGVHGVILIGGRIYDTGVVLFNTVKRDVEDALSDTFKTKVRHIADWDGSMPYGMEKREVVEPVPVFGMTMDGRDMHFSVLPGEGNSTRFRIGNGPGPDTENNRRLRARNLKYNNQIFESGGLDFVVESDETGLNHDDLQLNPSSQEDFDWIYKQVECYLAPKMLGSVLAEDPMEMMKNMNAIGGIFFQVLNDKQTMTMAYGKIAPFSSNHESMIYEMGGVREGGESNPACNNL
ncbi:hypothetical protein F66182_7442 [Fusarium sp. NRRL 66182]|nr:hypothetical protein F66182_7442 [Fusarium sp. NRRL 66182]